MSRVSRRTPSPEPLITPFRFIFRSDGADFRYRFGCIFERLLRGDDSCSGSNDVELDGKKIHPIDFIEKLESTVRELIRRFLVLQAGGLSQTKVLDSVEKAITSM